MTDTEYLDELIGRLQTMRSYATGTSKSAMIHATAMMVFEEACRPFILGERVGIVELFKFKMMIKALPEKFWPETDAVKAFANEPDRNL